MSTAIAAGIFIMPLRACQARAFEEMISIEGGLIIVPACEDRSEDHYRGRQIFVSAPAHQRRASEVRLTTAAYEHSASHLIRAPKEPEPCPCTHK
jgi:hypothetical protein